MRPRKSLSNFLLWDSWFSKNLTVIFQLYSDRFFSYWVIPSISISFIGFCHQNYVSLTNLQISLVEWAKIISNFGIAKWNLICDFSLMSKTIVTKSDEILHTGLWTHNLVQVCCCVKLFNPLQNGGRFKYFMNDMSWTTLNFVKSISPNKCW